MPGAFFATLDPAARHEDGENHENFDPSASRPPPPIGAGASPSTPVRTICGSPL